MDQKKKSQVHQDSNICPYCKGTTWIEKINPGKPSVMVRCKCYELKQVKDIWNNSDLRLEDLNKTFKNYEVKNKVQKDMLDTATSYFLRFEKIKNNEQNSIMLLGSPGVGKTHLLQAIAIKLIKECKVPVIYMSYVDVMTKLKQLKNDGTEYQKLINKYKNAKVLFIDDLFKGKITESDILVSFEIINFRINKRLPMMISSELILEDLIKYDRATTGRLFNAAKGFIMQVTGKENDYRLKTYFEAIGGLNE